MSLLQRLAQKRRRMTGGMEQQRFPTRVTQAPVGGGFPTCPKGTVLKCKDMSSEGAKAVVCWCQSVVVAGRKSVVVAGRLMMPSPGPLKDTLSCPEGYTPHCIEENGLYSCTCVGPDDVVAPTIDPSGGSPRALTSTPQSRNIAMLLPAIQAIPTGRSRSTSFRSQSGRLLAVGSRRIRRRRRPSKSRWDVTPFFGT